MLAWPGLTKTLERTLANASLSICLPVFNDVQELSKTLVSIRKIESSLDFSLYKNIEVVISDNQSDDGGWDLIQSFELEHIQVRKVRQPRNLGFRGNIEYLAQNASLEWILYLSCGDILIPSFNFGRLLDQLDQTRSGTAFYGYEMLDVSTGSRFSGESLSGDFATEQDQVLYSAAPMPFYKTKVLQGALANLEPTSGDWWPQIEWALAISAETGVAAYLGEGPITGNRPEIGWWVKPFAYVNVAEKAKLLSHWAPRHRARAKLLNESRKVWRTLPAWVFQTKVVFQNKTVLKDFRLLAPNLKHAPFPVLASLSILLTPRLILEAIRRLLRTWKS